MVRVIIFLFEYAETITNWADLYWLWLTPCFWMATLVKCTRRLSICWVELSYFALQKRQKPRRNLWYNFFLKLDLSETVSFSTMIVLILKSLTNKLVTDEMTSLERTSVGRTFSRRSIMDFLCTSIWRRTPERAVATTVILLYQLPNQSFLRLTIFWSGKAVHHWH